MALHTELPVYRDTYKLVLEVFVSTKNFPKEYDVVIQTDQPLKIATAIKISNSTNKIIWQNIGLALGVKILVLILGALGMATLWEAVIADVGVALLAILNAVRIQRMKWN
jgi:Cd2+/Zn2+-exporting ATPase